MARSDPRFDPALERAHTRNPLSIIMRATRAALASFGQLQ